MTDREHHTSLGRLARGAWRDGFVAAYLIVLGLNSAMSFLHVESIWLAGAFFGLTTGMVGGYLATLQRNYRRVKREDLEWQLKKIKQLELRVVARPHPMREEMLDDIHEGQRQLEAALEVFR